MKQIPDDTKDLLLRLRDRFPPERRDAFARSITSRLDSFASTSTASYGLAGALIGAIIDAIPGTGWRSDDWVEIGAAIGAWVGYSKDRKEREQRERVKQAVEEAIREALA
jgi:hypothetical protein